MSHCNCEDKEKKVVKRIYFAGHQKVVARNSVYIIVYIQYETMYRFEVERREKLV